MSFRKSLLTLFFVAALFLFVVSQQESGPESLLLNRKINLSSVSALFNTPSNSFKNPPTPKLKVEAALARELAGEKIFFELNANQRWPIASLTKLMTAVVALEKEGDRPQVTNLVKKMMLVSDNQAATELEAIIGPKEFIQEMNKKADQLGMSHTSFFDSTGLSYLNQSTVWDLDKLTAYAARKYPKIFQWSREPKLTIDGQLYRNINKFVGQPNFLGGKTGYTNNASGNLISIFSLGKSPVEIIVFGAVSEEERFKQTKILLEWISRYYKL